MANWTDEEKLKIWNKGEIVPGYDPKMWRKDQCGALIRWDKYGDRSSQDNNGWEIDHIKPDSKGGEDIIGNARPLQWYNNVTRSNGRLTCPITAVKK